MGIKRQEIAPPANKKMSKSALFTNYTNKEFIGWWDGKPKKFKPGQSMYMPDYLAKHFAKHLTNQELISENRSGQPVYVGGEKNTSPKIKIDKETGKEYVDNELFTELFNKAYTPDDEETEELGSPVDDVDAIIESTNKNRAIEENKKVVTPEEDKTEEFPGIPNNKVGSSSQDK